MSCTHVSVFGLPLDDKIVWQPTNSFLTHSILPLACMYMPIYIPHIYIHSSMFPIWFSARFNLLWFDINIFIYFFISFSLLCIQARSHCLNSCRG